MSVVNLMADMTITHIVEAMLPRFSDSKLGLYIDVKLDFFDWGYGADGNTVEREGLAVRTDIHFLFVRASNYTQVYALIERPEDSEIKYVLNGTHKYKWHRTSYHDSCWRSDGLNPLTDEYFHLAELFNGREITGKPMRPCDISKLNHLNYDPTFVEVDIQPANPEADKYSDEGRDFIIDMKPIDRYRLEQIGYKDERCSASGNWMADITSGVLIKGSEDHTRALEHKKRCDEKNGKLTD